LSEVNAADLAAPEKAAASSPIFFLASNFQPQLLVCSTDFFNQIELDDVAGEGEANAESDIDLLVTAVCGPGLKLPKISVPKRFIFICGRCMI